MNYDAKRMAAGSARIWTRRSPTEVIACRRARPLAASGIVLSLVLALRAAPAAQLTVEIEDRDNHPVADLIVTITPLTNSAHASGDRHKTAVMDQIDRRFVPQALVVARGTAVDFPNSDAVSHQVYSFSPAKKFQLPLYKGQKPPPIVFDQTGLVILGCNIHDSMIGYIYVTDAPVFGTTAPSGVFESPTIASGKYRIDVWSPRIAESVREGEASLTRDVSVDGATRAVFHLNSALRGAAQPRSHPQSWDSY